MQIRLSKSSYIYRWNCCLRKIYGASNEEPPAHWNLCAFYQSTIWLTVLLLVMAPIMTTLAVIGWITRCTTAVLVCLPYVGKWFYEIFDERVPIMLFDRFRAEDSRRRINSVITHPLDGFAVTSATGLVALLFTGLGIFIAAIVGQSLYWIVINFLNILMWLGVGVFMLFVGIGKLSSFLLFTAIPFVYKACVVTFTYLFEMPLTNWIYVVICLCAVVGLWLFLRSKYMVRVIDFLARDLEKTSDRVDAFANTRIKSPEKLMGTLSTCYAYIGAIKKKICPFVEFVDPEKRSDQNAS